ncbi:MAG: hypothetical protein D6791_05290, partial [Chloroflexi bacterium]
NRQWAAKLAVIVLTLGLSLLLWQAQTHANTAGDGNISNTSTDSGGPAIAVAADGTRFVAWEEEGTQVYTAVEGQAGWLAGPLADGDSPALAAAPGGIAHLVYTADDGTGNLEIYHSRWTATGWTPPANVSQTSGTSAEPDVAVAADGTPHFVWTDSTLGEPTLYQGTPDGASPVFNARGTAPAIAMDSSDRVHLVWQEPDDDTGLGEIYHIFMQSGNGQTWSFAENMSNSPDVESHTPDIAIDAQGTIHIAWVEGNAVQVASGQPANFGPPTVLSEVATGTASVRIAADTAGNVFAAWTEEGVRIRIAMRPAGTSTWTPAQTVADDLAGLGTLAIDARADGVAHIAWSAYPAGSTAGDIYVRAVQVAAPTMRKVYLPLLRRP